MIGGEGVERGRAPVEGAPRSLDLEDGRLAGREVDAVVVGPPHGLNRVPCATVAEEIPVLPVERCHRGAGACPREHHRDRHDSETHCGPRDETASIPDAVDHDRPEGREQRERAHRDGVARRQDGRRPTDSAGRDRRGEERLAAGRDSEREAERAGGEQDESVQLGVGRGDERRCDGVDVSQALSDDVVDRPQARSSRHQGEHQEREDGDGDAHGESRRQRGRNRQGDAVR